jgi:bile acid:Na+ symporter, BASS family
VRVLRLISQNLALLTLAGAVAAYLFPPAFLVFRGVFLYFFAVTMFALGLVLDPEEVRDPLRKPKSILLGLFTQYTVMPLLGLLTALLSGFSPGLALGFILVGCAPGAMASNLIVYWAGCAAGFSVALTTVSTFISPLVTPSLAQLLGGVYLPVPFWPMLRTILVIVVAPLAAGMVLRPFTDNVRTVVRAAAPAAAVLAVVVICGYAVASNQELIGRVGGMVFLWVVVLNALGYLFGWLAATLYRFNSRYRISLAIEIGMQNAGLGVALALEHFGSETALPGALFAVWCIVTAAAATSVLRRRARGWNTCDRS